MCVVCNADKCLERSDSSCVIFKWSSQRRAEQEVGIYLFSPLFTVAFCFAISGGSLPERRQEVAPIDPNTCRIPTWRFLCWILYLLCWKETESSIPPPTSDNPSLWYSLISPGCSALLTPLIEMGMSIKEPKNLQPGPHIKREKKKSVHVLVVRTTWVCVHLCLFASE